MYFLLVIGASRKDIVEIEDISGLKDLKSLDVEDLNNIILVDRVLDCGDIIKSILQILKRFLAKSIMSIL